MAKEHGIEMIRINCYYSRLEYIKKNILKSKLAELFDLSDFDWGKCDEKARKNIEKLILNFNLTFSTLKIKEQVDLFNSQYGYSISNNYYTKILRKFNRFQRNKNRK